MDKLQEERPSILYVDDIDNNLILFEAVFKDHFNVATVTSGKEALELMGTREFSVLISDQSMPEMTGTQLLEIAKERYPDTMRFIITAYTDYKTVVDSINKGEIYGFFNKPFDTDTVLMALNKAIEVYNLRIANRKMIRELAKVNAELLDLDKTKTKYLDAITNEIRSPINKIMSAVHILKDRLGSNELSELLYYLDTSVSRLESFSFAAGQLARFNEEGGDKLEFSNISVRELIEFCILENKNLLDKFQTSVELGGLEEDVYIKGEYSLLMTCLTTMLMNSLKYSEKGGCLKISAGTENNTKFIEISDQTNTYTQVHIENLINFFSGNRKQTGFIPGIELLLVRQIMTAHHGNIVITPENDNLLSLRMIFPVLNP
jgi:two-component system, sensor histidine kinase and response regulator